MDQLEAQQDRTVDERAFDDVEPEHLAETFHANMVAALAGQDPHVETARVERIRCIARRRMDFAILAVAA